MTIDPDPRTAPDDNDDSTTQDATNQGVSSEQPAEGDDDAPAGGAGSPDQA
ncbi:hypothetical protein [Sphingomonas sp. BK235]|uniref:hypothetical protein n=1 Tax=Sphingomonas sp. BK235 TaxID=2512131 RepID=UPI0010DDF98A|nr:hypothetical protein [Sphingomonas sp. BK235]TCP32861.1 hypothetical protein EV292_107201 [Sphingomonas sp. BK235]